MKNSRLFKAICLAINIIFILSSVPFSAAAADQPSLGVSDLSPEAFHRIVSQSVNKLPDEIYSNLSLCDEDLPEAMAGSGIEETEAVVRLKGQEKELSSLLYANADGTYTEYFFTENVKFEKDGEVKDKSNKLTYSKRLGGFTNEENDINVILPSVYPSENGVSLAYAENIISFKAEECASSEAEYIKGENGKDKVVYKNVFAPGVDLEYHAQFSGVKENIILNAKPQSNTFSFRIKTNGAYLQNEYGSVMIFEEKGEYIGYIGELYIYDAEGKTGSGEVQLEEIKAGDEYLYILTVDNEYLNSGNTVYPVTVDPTFSFGTSYIRDSKLMYDNGSYTLNATCTTVRLGYAGLMQFNRMLVKFTSMKQIVQHIGLSNISSINLVLSRTPDTATAGSTQFNCYRMTASWGNSSGSSSSTVWNGYDSSSVISGWFLAPYQTFYLNIKPYYQSWLSGSNDYGVMLQLPNEANMDCSDIMTKEHSSGGGPYITIVYTVPSSIEAAGLKDRGLHTFCSINGIQYPYLQSSALTINNSTMYSLTLNDGTVSTGSTLENSPYFAVYADGSNGYFKMSPTNANYKGSSALYGSTEINYVYYDGSSLGISDDYNTSNKSSWYLIKTSSDIRYILNRYYSNVAIRVNAYGTAVDHGAPGFMADESKWSVAVVGLDVPLQKQESGNWCGPASILQCLTYLGLYDSITGNNNAQKQESIANEVLNQDDDGDPRLMVPYLNNTIGSAVYERKTSVTDFNDLSDIIHDSLLNNYPAIAQLKPMLLEEEYYDDYPYSSGHFMVIAGYDSTSHYYIVRDCNNTDYDDDGICEYFGEFLIDSESLYGASYNASRLVMSN